MGRQNILIIGAPRSGTNMLRDVLTRLPGLTTWPCDEINYIWRHGNVRFPSDEFTPEMATPALQRYIRRQFDGMARRNGGDRVVEKTCANSLRVGFVHRVLPDAQFIFIRRNGVDVVASALKRWQAPLDIPYLYRKARFVPAADLPYYASSYLFNRVYRLFSRGKRLASWGPRTNDLSSLLQGHTLAEVCALQWKRCVDSAEQQLARVPGDQVVEVAYESFVAEPVKELRRISDFLGLDVREESLQEAVAIVSRQSVGKGGRALDSGVLDDIGPLIAETMRRHGYAA